MPAKSILENRIREKLDEARNFEESWRRALDALEVDVNEHKQALYRAQNEVALLEGLLAPDSDESFRENVTESLKQLHTEEGSPLHPGYVPDRGAGEDGLPGHAPANGGASDE